MGSRHDNWDSGYPTLIQILNLPSAQPNWGLQTSTHLLPLPPEAYYTHQSDDLWFVTVRATGEFVYIGPGPVQITVSEAPF